MCCFCSSFRCRRCSLNRTLKLKSFTCFAQAPFKFRIQLIDFTRVGSGHALCSPPESVPLFFFSYSCFAERFQERNKLRCRWVYSQKREVCHSGQLKYQVFPRQSFPNQSQKNFLKEILNQNKNRTLLEIYKMKTKDYKKTQTLLNVYA